jgi:hypothetical protein
MKPKKFKKTDSLQRDAKLYQCINNGFDTSFRFVDYKYYGLVISPKYIDIYDGDEWITTWEVQKWQDFNDYFISKGDLRDKQIDSILND